MVVNPLSYLFDMTVIRCDSSANQFHFANTYRRTVANELAFAQAESTVGAVRTQNVVI